MQIELTVRVKVEGRVAGSEKEVQQKIMVPLAHAGFQRLGGGECVLFCPLMFPHGPVPVVENYDRVLFAIRDAGHSLIRPKLD